MNKKLIFGIAILAIVSLAFSIWLYTERWVDLPLVPPIEPSFVPLRKPALGDISTQGYVYDDKLGYGFEYPGGWEFLIERGDFPDRNIKKVVSFEKSFKHKFEGFEREAEVLVSITLIVKTAACLQEVTNEFKKELEVSGVPILNETAISVNNISGYDILSGTPGWWKLRQVVFFDNGTAYIFRYSSQYKFYRMYEDTFDNIINSFNIKEKP